MPYFGHFDVDGTRISVFTTSPTSIMAKNGGMYVNLASNINPKPVKRELYLHFHASKSTNSAEQDYASASAIQFSHLVTNQPITLKTPGPLQSGVSSGAEYESQGSAFWPCDYILQSISIKPSEMNFLQPGAFDFTIERMVSDCEDSSKFSYLDCGDVKKENEGLNRILSLGRPAFEDEAQKWEAAIVSVNQQSTGGASVAKLAMQRGSIDEFYVHLEASSGTSSNF